MTCSAGRPILKWTGSCTTERQFWFIQLVIRHHHQYRACRVLCLVTCSSPINIPKVFGAGRWLPFPHGWHFIIKCGSLSVSVHSPNMLYLFIFVVFNSLYNWVNFVVLTNTFIGFVILPCALCSSPHKFHFRWHYPGFILFSNCPSFASVL